MTMMRRVALIVAAVLLFGLGGGLLIQGLLLQQTVQRLLALRGHEAAAALAAELGSQQGNSSAMQTLIARRAGPAQLRRVRLFDPQGKLLAEVAPQAREPMAPAWVTAVMDFRVPTSRALVGDGRRESAELQVEPDPVWAQDLLWTSLESLAGWLALLAAVAAALLGWSLRAWQQLFTTVLAQAQDLEHGRYVQAAETQRPDLPELRGLTRSMNATVLRLREMFTAQAEQVAMLQRQAQLDAVTGLPLRQVFLGQLQQRLAEPGAPPMALLLVRLLHLESLNPRLGHEATDRLLGAIADVLQTYVDRVPGTFAGRLNGSDFALCLPVAGLAIETAESLRAALAAVPALRIGGAEAVVGGVDGLHDSSPGAALAAADAALARAEDDDGVAVEQQGELVADAAGARAWRTQIADALAQGRARLAEFPVVDRSGALLHLDCPLRVQLQPGGEFLAAARWLALARRSRLLPQVDLMAVDLALRAIAGDGRARAVHAALPSLSAPGFVAEVLALLQAVPAAAQQLSIEVVEGVRPQARVPLADAAAAWTACGVRVGVQHAAATPQQLPGLREAGVSYVHVQARHLRGLADDAAVRGYAQSLVALVHGLGLQAVAGGLDDADDRAAVWALGFDAASGPAPPPG